MLQNQRILYNLLVRCASATLLEVAAHPKCFGAEIGFLCVLHTWGTTLAGVPGCLMCVCANAVTAKIVGPILSDAKIRL
jgi:hypothetical protein